jgi:flagellar L-ring protein precursor FlgH
MALVMVATAAAAADPQGSDNYDAVFAKYLSQARASAEAPRVNDWSWMSRLALDHRARGVNDLLTIRVVESITASGTADAATSKASSAGIAVPSLFGIEKHLPGSIDPASLASSKANTDFKGSGATTRTGELSALITARVSDVLPNGDLVVEGVREIDINGDRQIVVLTGVVRPYDINPGNVVLSTYIGQLRIRYFGRGLTQDNLKPGWLIRILNKVF